MTDSLRAAVEAGWIARNDFAFDPSAPKVRLHEPTFGPDEVMAALDCLMETRVTMGAKVLAFEARFKNHHGAAHGTMVNSGSSANLLAVAAVANHETRDGLRPGDEVIVPALSWSTTVWPLVQLGLVPVVVDIEPRTLNIDPEAVERAIGPRTRGLMPVHVYGNPCPMDALTDICQRRGLILIEDCCEALGASFRGTPVGRFGRVGTFSTYYSHHITTLEGGVCLTDDFELAETMRILRAHGWVREVEDPKPWFDRHPDIDPRFLFVNLGYNLRPTELQGAIGQVQLPKLDGFVAFRRELAAWYRGALSRFGDFLTFQDEAEGGFHSWMTFAVQVRESAPFRVGALRAHLEAGGVETRPIICGNVARQPGLAPHPHRVAGDLRHSDRVMDGGFSIGCHQHVGEAARAHVAERFAAFFAERGLVR